MGSGRPAGRRRARNGIWKGSRYPSCPNSASSLPLRRVKKMGRAGTGRLEQCASRRGNRGNGPGGEVGKGRSEVVKNKGWGKGAGEGSESRGADGRSGRTLGAPPPHFETHPPDPPRLARPLPAEPRRQECGAVAPPRVPMCLSLMLLAPIAPPQPPPRPDGPRSRSRQRPQIRGRRAAQPRLGKASGKNETPTK